MLKQTTAFGSKLFEMLRQRQAGAARQSRTVKLMKVIEPILLGMLWTAYFYGIHQLMQHIGGSMGLIAPSVLALLMVLMFLVFVENSFVGKSIPIRWVARTGMFMFMVLAALMTGALTYTIFFGAENADRQAFSAANQLETYSQELSREYSVASDRYNAVATLSDARSAEEAKSGGTCGDGSHGTAGVRSAWRDTFARSTKADADEIADRARGVSAIASDVKAFSAHFDPNQTAVMQSEWADLTGRLQALGGDGRIAQIISGTRDRLNAADRSIGIENRRDGKAHVVTCSDADLRGLSESAIDALKAIKPPPVLSNSIIGANLESAWHRMVTMVAKIFGMSSEEVAPEEYIIFLLAVALEGLFVAAKWISYSHMEPQQETAARPPILEKIALLWRNGGMQHEFMNPKPFVIERNARRVRLAVPNDDQNKLAMDCLDLLVADGHASHLDDKLADDLEASVLARVRKNGIGEFSEVTIFDMPSHTWNSLVSASAPRL
jgi:hypothetical protein